MKKNLFIIILCSLLLFSCNNDIVEEEKKDDPIPPSTNTISIDLSTNTGEWFAVTADTVVSFEKMKDDELYVVYAQGSISKSVKDNSNKNLMNNGSGGYILIPNEESKVSLLPSDVNIGNGGHLKVKALKPLSGNGIAFVEDMTQPFPRKSEGFFHINFNKDYANIDRANIALLKKSIRPTSGTKPDVGSHFSGIITKNKGFSSNQRIGIMDFSDKSFVNVYAYEENISGDYTEPHKTYIYLRNPIEIVPDTPTEITNNQVMRINAENDAAEYVLEIDSSEYLSTSTSQANPRYLTGERRPLFLNMNREGTKIYLGELDQDFIFDLYERTDKTNTDLGKITLRKLADAEAKEVVKIAINGEEQVLFDSSTMGIPGDINNTYIAAIFYPAEGFDYSIFDSRTITVCIYGTDGKLLEDPAVLRDKVNINYVIRNYNGGGHTSAPIASNGEKVKLVNPYDPTDTHYCLESATINIKSLKEGERIEIKISE